MQDLQNYNLSHLCSALDLCLGYEGHDAPPLLCSTSGPLSRTRRFLEQRQSLTNYLLQTGSTTEMLISDTSALYDETIPSTPASRSFESNSLVLNFCLSETEKVNEAWSRFSSERNTPVTQSMLSVLTALCVINSRLIGTLAGESHGHLASLRNSNDRLIGELTTYLSTHECERQKVDAVLVTFSSILPDPARLETLNSNQFTKVGALPLALHLTHAIVGRRRAEESINVDANDDVMDIDDEFESQASRGRSTSKDLEIPRDVMSASDEFVTFRASTSAYLSLIASSSQASTDGSSIESLPGEYLEHLQTLSDNELCACQPLIRSIIQSPLPILWEDAQSFMEHLAKTFLEEYEHERNEVVISFCLDVTTGFASKWAGPGADADNIGNQIYSWAVELVRKPGIASPQIQMQVANLCYRLDQLQANYADARTTLLHLMRTGDVPVKYDVAKLIPDMFGHSVLDTHREMFGEVLEDLPNKTGWPEGIAIRLFALSQLASSWQTLLRECVYYIFDAAATIPECRKHAAACVSSIARSLDLEDSQALFKVFASQLLFTWGEGQDKRIADIPFKIFGYDSLEMLVTDVRDEIVGQWIMRGKEKELRALSTMFNMSINELATRNFGRAAAYSLSWDVTRSLSQSDNFISSESFLINLVGKDNLIHLMDQHSHEILGLFLCTVEQADNIEKIYKDKPHTTNLAKMVEEMKKMSSSDANPLPVMQPSFPAKNLPFVLERFAKRIRVEPLSLWTEERFVYVLRMLFTSMTPALGSLNACGCIRKIRLAMAFAGGVSTRGYPLEMSLHALRPYLSDAHCSDDTLGIVQYLYTHGKSHLESNLAFTSGSAVATLLSLRTFLGSVQDQTTQDTQHKATMRKARDFRNWFSAYLTSLEPSNTSGSESKRFGHLVKLATRSFTDGNAWSGSPEANLLIELFNDELTARSLLNKTMRDLILIDIQQSFQPPPTCREDVLSTDPRASAYAAQIWKSTSQPHVSRNYLLWAARTVGRAFNSQNNARSFAHHLMSDKRPERRLIEQEKMSPFQEAIFRSRSSIIQAVYDLLQSTDQAHVGIGEETLRSFFERSHNKDATSWQSIHSVVPVDVQRALHLARRMMPQMSAVGTSIVGCSTGHDHLNSSDWIRDVTLALISTSSGDPILGALGGALQSMSHLAQIVYPQVLHLALVFDHDGDRSIRAEMSQLYRDWLSSDIEPDNQHVKLLLDGLLYLRRQAFPREATNKDRDQWLEIDHLEVSRAALRCGMHAAALLFSETYERGGGKRLSKRSSNILAPELPADLLLEIYENLPEPDYFYGVQNEDSLDAALARFDYEGDGYKSLVFRGARVDSQTRRGEAIAMTDTSGITKSLMDLNLNSLAQVMLADSRFHDSQGRLAGASLTAARKLEQWDIKVTEDQITESGIVYGVFQSLSSLTHEKNIRDGLELGFLNALKLAKKANANPKLMHEAFRAMSVLSETDEILSCRSHSMLHDGLVDILKRHRQGNDAR